MEKRSRLADSAQDTQTPSKKEAPLFWLVWGFLGIDFGFLQGSGKGFKLCRSVRQVNIVLHSAIESYP